jgi:hypothetical protein
MDMKVYVVTECGKENNYMFSKQIGVYSTLEKAQARMNDCFEKTIKILRESSRVSIGTFETDPMETTILFHNMGGYANKHMVVIDERNVDEDADDFYFVESE